MRLSDHFVFHLSLCSCFSGFVGATAATSGTMVKFTPPAGTETMLKGGSQQNMNTRHQCITAMKEYESKSLEVGSCVLGMSDVAYIVSPARFLCSRENLKLNFQALNILLYLNFIKLPGKYWKTKESYALFDVLFFFGIM